MEKDPVHQQMEKVSIEFYHTGRILFHNSDIFLDYSLSPNVVTTDFLLFDKDKFFVLPVEI